jgi:hypothetical protein
MTEAAIKLPNRASYTVDDLFEIPDDGHRYEVFAGSLVMSPTPAPMHQYVADELRSILSPLVRPHRARAMTALTIRVTDEDGPIPDLAVVSGNVLALPELPLAVGPDAWITVTLDPAELVTL